MIYISTVNRRGNAHQDWNEDNYFLHQTEKAIIGGVFDGCSSGKDSYFASKLFANVLKNTIQKGNTVVTIHQFPELVKVYLENLNKSIAILGLSEDEILSTAILFVYEIDTSQLLVKFFGDGIAYANQNELISCNNDEANQPDYLGYSLDNIVKTNDFRDYWLKKKEFRSKTKDFSIATDGIFSFKKKNESIPDIPLEHYLVSDLFLYKNPSSLKRKLNILKNKGFEHDDDVTILRIINEHNHEQTKTI